MWSNVANEIFFFMVFVFFLCLSTVAGGKALANRGRYLLGRTDNVGDPKSKTNQQATAGMVPVLHSPHMSMFAQSILPHAGNK